MSKKTDIKQQNVDELQALYHDLSREIFSMKNELRMTRKLEKPHLLKEKKKERARVLTFLNQKGKKVS